MVDFNEFFVFMIENNDIIKEELDKISEIPLNCLEDGDISLCVVVTSMDIDEVNNTLKEHDDGSFFIIDLNSNKGLRYKINNEDYREHLFSELESFREDNVKNSSESSMDMVNYILDKGKENLTQRDYDILNRLTDKNNKGKNEDE